MVSLNELQSIPYNRQVSQPQKVHLKQSQFFDSSHGELCSRTFVRKVQRNILVYRCLGNHHSGSMGRSVARHTFYGFRHVDNLTGLTVLFIHGFKLRAGGKCLVYGHVKLKGNSLGDGIRLGIAYTQGSGNISYRLLCLHGSEGYYLRNPALAVLAGNIVDYLLTALIAEVYIDVGHADPFRIEETLKDQIVPDRVNVGYLKAVGHNGAGCRASPRTYHNAVCLGVVYEIPYNQEIFNISHGFYSAKLVVQSFVQLRSRVFSVSFVKARLTELSQIFCIVLSLRGLEFRQMVLAEFKVKITGIGNKLSIIHRLRKVCKDFSHFVFAFQIELVVRKAHTVLIIESGRGLDGQQHIMGLGVFLAHIMYIVGGHKGHIQFAPQPDQIILYGHFLLKTLVLDFQIEIPRSEDIQKCLRFSPGAGIIVNQQAVLYISRKTG